MTQLEIDIFEIGGALLVLLVGMASVLVSVFRLRSRDYSLLSFGIFCSVYGIRWLTETETMRILLGFPFNAPYFHALLTYVVPIPLTAFLVAIFGRGLSSFLFWVCWSTVVYALGAVAIDLLTGATQADASINAIVVLIWCVIGLVNLIFLKRHQRSELIVVRGVIIALFIAVANDNLVNMGFLPWETRVEHVDVLIVCFGLGYVAVRRFFSTEHALLSIQQEMAIARRIQQANLPVDLPSPEGISIAAKYVPMSTVAGDFYDIQADNNDRIAILIADVSGHGVGAALIGSMLKIGFATQIQHLADPARVLSELNRVLRDKMGDSFVTACAVFIDLRQGCLRYANAGHPLPILLRSNVDIPIVLTGGGTILGPFPDVVYENTEVVIGAGDRLVLYTDGLVESRNKAKEFFGEERLTELLTDHRNAPAEEASSRIVEHLLEWSGKSRDGSLDDDLTLVIVDIG